MTTLRREIRQIISDKLGKHIRYWKGNGNAETLGEIADEIADEIIKLRAFDPEEERKQRMKDLMAKKSIEFAILTGAQVKEEDQGQRVVESEALASFERELRFNPLPWETTKEWNRLRDFVTQEYAKDRNIWRKYNDWRMSDGRFNGAMNNKNIRFRPADFIDCFPDFLARVNNGVSKPNQSENKEDENGIPVTY